MATLLDTNNFALNNLSGLSYGTGLDTGSDLTSALGSTGFTSALGTSGLGSFTGADSSGLLGSLSSSGLGSLFSSNSMFGGLNDKGQASGGWVSPLASLASTIFGAIQGNKQLSLAQDQFDESKRQFDVNYAANKQTTNTELEDRQRARVASNASAYESVDSYMAKNAIQ